MKSPFDFVDSGNNVLKTNNFDWSHTFNFTTGIGKITPFFCQLVPAHTGLSFQPRLGLNFMPMVFPLQSRMNARVSFFKVPLRTLWKDYKDFVGNFRDGLVEPYHDFKDNVPQTGSLFDYLGLPTTLIGMYGTSLGSITSTYISDIGEIGFIETSVTSSDIRDFMKVEELTVQVLRDYISQVSSSTIQTSILATYNGTPSDKLCYLVTDTLSLSGKTTRLSVRFDGSQQIEKFYKYLVLSGYSSAAGGQNLFSAVASSVVPLDNNQSMVIFDLDKEIDLSELNNISMYIMPRSSIVPADVPYVYSLTEDRIHVGLWSRGVADGYPTYKGFEEVQEINSDTSPYYDSSSSNAEKQLKISAYAARAYESVYNAYFRDNRNNPYYVDGEVQYNKWIPSDAGGADTFKYQLHYANWEKDAFTTAVQSPQQGIAPLVGITTYQETVTTEDGQTNIVNRVAMVDEEGRKFGVEFVSDEEGLKDVNYTRLAGDRAVSKPSSLLELAQSGISINDIRNVNAYQKFLELNMRQGYSYKEIIEGRFDVSVRYNELQMPEFIGGFTEPVSFGSQSQTVQRADTGEYADQLGALAGTGGVRRDGQNISVFCDEESIVIGLCVVTPVPIYTQVLPKHFLYRGLLDHFQPEFANIGFQPITYRELCPIQAFNENPDSLYETFGYNRPWYEYCQQLDTAHGLYRTQLRNFIMNRTFDYKPELSESFLLIDPNQVNDVFAVTSVTDKIFGAVFIQGTAKLPISRTAIPRLD